MLRIGVAVDEAYARVQALVGIEDAVHTAEVVSSGHASVAAADGPDEPQVCASVGTSPVPLDDLCPRSQAAEVDRDRFTDAVRLNRQHWIDTGRPISAETLRQRLHVSADASRELTRAVRAADRAAVIAAGVPA